MSQKFTFTSCDTKQIALHFMTITAHCDDNKRHSKAEIHTESKYPLMDYILFMTYCFFYMHITKETACNEPKFRFLMRISSNNLSPYGTSLTFQTFFYLNFIFVNNRLAIHSVTKIEILAFASFVISVTNYPPWGRINFT